MHGGKIKTSCKSIILPDVAFVCFQFSGEREGRSLIICPVGKFREAPDCRGGKNTEQVTVQGLLAGACAEALAQACARDPIGGGFK